jgi:hypothetical protein
MKEEEEDSNILTVCGSFDDTFTTISQKDDKIKS